MNLEIKDAVGNVPVTILILEGNIDGLNYNELIDEVHALHEAGCRDLILDLAQVNFISSAGLVAVHRAALIMQGGERFDTEDGWQALHALERDLGTGFQPHIKILNPQPKIAKVFESIMMDQYIEIFTDEDAAVASF